MGNFWKKIKSFFTGKKSEPPKALPPESAPPKVEPISKPAPKPEVPSEKDSIKPIISDVAKEVLSEASKYVGVTEKGGNNKGPEVQKFQKAVDGVAQGEPWCLSFCFYVIKEVSQKLKIKNMLFPTEHCLTLWKKTNPSMRIQNPVPGCLIVWNYKGTVNGHVGIVTKVLGPNLVRTIEGNTGPTAGEVVREGDGVYTKERSLSGTEKMKVLGFLLPFEEMKNLK